MYDPQARRLLGVHYETDGYGTAWLDPQMRAAQAAVDALLPATINRIDCERCTSAPTMLVTALSDRQPPFYYLYNRDTKALTPIGASRPWIKARGDGRSRHASLCRARRTVDPGARNPSARARRGARVPRWCWCTADPGCAGRIGSGSRKRNSSRPAATW